MSSRNVLNAQEVARLVDELAQQTDRPELRRWLKASARRWILKHHDLYDRVAYDPAAGAFVLVRPGGHPDAAPRAYGGEVPAWCRAALARGEEVVVLRLGASLMKRLARLTAQLEAELSQGSLTCLERLSFEKAESRLRKRRREGYDARRRRHIARGAVPVFHGTDGSGVVRLTSRESLADEGSRMHHCVGGYGYPDAVARGECEIYSLRGRDGRPLATLEVEDGQVLQVKGFANGPLGGPERVVLRAFIRRRGYALRGDRRNLFLRQRDFRCKPRALEGDLLAGGLALLHANRYAALGASAYSEVKTLVCRVIACAGSLSPEVLERLYRAVAPDRGEPLRVRRRRTFAVYGLEVELHEVALPLAFLNLGRFSAFRACGRERETRALRRRAESDLTNLALAAPERLFALGARYNAGDIRSRVQDCPADLLSDARIDVSSLRAQRHDVLRRRLNLAKRRTLGRRAAPAAGHRALRRLLEGADGDFVL